MTSIDPQRQPHLDVGWRDPPRSTASHRSFAEGAMTGSEFFLEHRSLLFSIAYRMLGSVADAEDAVQETYLRWRRAAETGDEIRSPKAWLTTTISRVCLDQLGSARVKREQYIGPWLPEPVAGAAPALCGRSGSEGETHGRLPARGVRGRHAGPHRDADRRRDGRLRRRRQGQRGPQTGHRSRQGGAV